MWSCRTHPLIWETEQPFSVIYDVVATLQYTFLSFFLFLFLVWLDIMRVAFLPLILLLSTVAAVDIFQSRQPELELLNTTSRSSSTISAAWYAGWHATSFPLSQVSWSKYTNLIYAFAWVVRLISSFHGSSPCFVHRVTTPDVTALSLAPADEILLPQFVSTAHQHVSLYMCNEHQPTLLSRM